VLNGRAQYNLTVFKVLSWVSPELGKSRPTLVGTSGLMDKTFVTVSINLSHTQSYLNYSHVLAEKIKGDLVSATSPVV
jgi:hypothetical protein